MPSQDPTQTSLNNKAARYSFVRSLHTKLISSYCFRILSFFTEKQFFIFLGQNFTDKEVMPPKSKDKKKKKGKGSKSGDAKPKTKDEEILTFNEAVLLSQ